MFTKRPDGRLVKDLDPMQQIMPYVMNGRIYTRPKIGVSFVSDERFCDGLYFALSLRKLRKIMMNPACLEKPLEAKVEDAD